MVCRCQSTFLAVIIYGRNGGNQQSLELEGREDFQGVIAKRECVGKSEREDRVTDETERCSPTRFDHLFTPQDLIGAKKIRFPACCPG